MHDMIIAVCSRDKARFYSASQHFTGLNLIHALDNPEGKLQAHDLVSDKSGESASSSHQGHNALSSEHNAVDIETSRFARSVANFLNWVRVDHQSKQLVISADAKLTGKLKEHLDKNTLQMVRDFVIKDLTKVPTSELVGHLKREVTI